MPLLTSWKFWNISHYRNYHKPYYIAFDETVVIVVM